MEIPDIRIKGGDIDIIRIPITPDYLLQPPQALEVGPPITTQVGVPIVDMPGCVEAHEQNTSREKSGVLGDDDPKGVKVYCDSGVPSFNPMNYNPDELEFTGEAQVPPVRPPESPKVPKTPKIPKQEAKTVNCPTEAQKLKEPVGTLVDGGTKKIVEYRLIGQECIPVKEDIKIPDQIIQAIPTAGSITTTAGIAVVATTSALLAKPLADLVLKAVKPTVKTIIKKIAKLRGKHVPHESVKDRRDQQRIRSHAIRKLKGKE